MQSSPESYLNSLATIMSSGGDMPEFALTLLSSMPDRWDIDTWTLILMRGYALAFGYQSSEFYPEPAGVMGRGKEQEIQHRSATGKGGKDFALAHQEQIQSVMPPTLEFEYEQRDVSGEQEDAALKLAKAQVITEMSKWLVNAQSVLTAEQVMQLAAQDGIVPEEWTPGEEQVTTTDEDASPEAESERVYRACMAFPDEPIVRYQWPSGKTRILRMTGRRVFYFPKVVERSIGQVVRAYRDALTNWAYEVMGGRMEATDMRRAHKALIRKTAQEVYFEGMREGGIRNPADEADTEDFTRIKEWVTTQVAHADDFAAAAGEVRADETKRAGILNRLGLWVDSVDSLGQQGVMSAKSNRPGIWHLGQTEQHCTTCAGLDGKRHRVNWFLTRGYIPRQPGNEMLECGGWNCDCFISDATTGKMLVRFDPAQPRDEQGQWTDTGASKKTYSVLTETDLDTADIIASQGIEPSFKPQITNPTMYGPGKGAEREGTYVASEGAFTPGTFGDARVHMDIPKENLKVPPEWWSESGKANDYTDIEKALSEENGAVTVGTISTKHITSIEVYNRSIRKWETYTRVEYLHKRGIPESLPKLPTVTEYGDWLKTKQKEFYLSSMQVEEQIHNYNRYTLKEKYQLFSEMKSLPDSVMDWALS